MTMLEESLLCATAVVVALVLAMKYSLSPPKIRRNGRKLRKPPDTLPVLGNGLRFLQARQKLFHWFCWCERIFGYETFAIYVPTLPPGVVINDPKNLEFVFKNEALFGKGDFFKTRSWDLFGHGIINADGELWKAQRKAGLAFLNASNLKILNDVALVRYLGKTVEFLERKADDGTVVDLQDVFHELMSLLMGKMAYNMEIHTNDTFTRSFDHASAITAERFQNPFWFFVDLFRPSFWKSVRTVRAFGDEIVATALADQRKKSKTNNEVRLEENEDDYGMDHTSGSLIKSLLSSLQDASIASDAALNYLSAGRDTTAQALTWTFHLLFQHPPVRQEIMRDINKTLHLSSSSSPSSCPQLPEQRNKTGTGSCSLFDPTLVTPLTNPYILATFTESLRLHPPVPFEIKQVTGSDGTTLPDGTFLPRNSVVVWCTWAMSRSRDTWGEDADVFRPERWLVHRAAAPAGPTDESGLHGGKEPDGRSVSFMAKSAHEFPVFNGGQRLCLGKKMAEAVAVRTIATLLWYFEFAPAYEWERVSRSSLTLPMEGGLPVRVRRRGMRDLGS